MVSIKVIEENKNLKGSLKQICALCETLSVSVNNYTDLNNAIRQIYIIAQEAKELKEK